MQAAFGIRHGPINFFFDLEVIFHVLFLLGTEESTITLTITPVWDLMETWGFHINGLSNNSIRGLFNTQLEAMGTSNANS